MKELNNKIMGVVHEKGPVLPIEISKELKDTYNRDLIFFSAILSELVSEKKIHFTSAKIGSSPLYYVNGQEQKLERLYQYLKNVEKEAYNIIKEKKVARDSELHPHQRVAIRAIKDFAIPIEVEDNGNKELFWKWYLTNNEEAKEIIKPILQKRKLKPQKIEVKKEKVVEVKKEKKTFIKPEDYRAKVITFFQHTKIKVVDENIIRKNNDIEFVIKVPSAIGETKFFAKVKNKKTISKADISLAYNIAATKKIPLIFITSGEISKKTYDYVEKHMEGIIIKKV